MAIMELSVVPVSVTNLESIEGLGANKARAIISLCPTIGELAGCDPAEIAAKIKGVSATSVAAAKKWAASVMEEEEEVASSIGPLAISDDETSTPTRVQEIRSKFDKNLIVRKELKETA